MFRTLKPEKVYVTDDVYKDDRAVACVERMMTAMNGAKAEKVSYDELNQIAPQRWAQYSKNDWRWGAEPNPRDPDLVMTTAKFWPDEEKKKFRARYPNLGVRDLYGFTTKSWRPDGEPDWRHTHKGCVCHSAWEFHSICGCPFRCAYCWFGGVNRILVNMEEYVEHLDEICALGPFQRIYKWDNQTDVTCFEPEYGASKLLVEYFANKPDKYLEIYAGKSDNIDDLLAYDHKGKTIIQWSISPRTQSTIMEPETAPWDKRVEAARKCGEAGYIARYRFSPMIPVRNWKEEYAELIELIFARSKPDVISLCAFGWMDVELARKCLDFSMLDPDFVAAMEAEAPFIRKRGFTSGGGRPIPHDARAYMFKAVIDEIRKHHKTIPISLCLETVEMWALFERELGMPMDPKKKAGYYCNCGPMCTPEHRFSKGVTPGPSWFGDPSEQKQ
ncbi:MAG: spore photoproduct lyase family protein [Planctomycetota bacterium]